MKKILSQSGMTFMEVIVAVTVLIVGVIGGLTLTIFNLNTSVASEGKLMAANLAREGIEVIRQFRDSNWLGNDDWNNGFSGIGRLIVEFDPAGNIWSITEVDVAGIVSCTECQLYYDSADGIFSHSSAGEATGYKRLITINEICWQDSIEDEAVLNYGSQCSANTLVGYQLTTEVVWRDNNLDRTLSIIDRIYDWR